MTHHIGIDLGTTNSAVCLYDGENVRLFKSPEQNDVTPSAIFFTKRGNKYVGRQAYDNAARDADSAATLFKRLMGTSTPVKLSAVNLTMTPEECSAEILRTLFGYLPEEIRNDPDTGTVITVPAAFNLMQKDATMAAAEMAGLGSVALMQEPVAAVMSVMRHRKGDGVFLVYDLGGGTLDIAIAQSISGRVSLLAHGGIAMCGGRDFDRLLLDNVVTPWLLQNFEIPENFFADKQRYGLLRSMATWATEKAKIELSSNENAIITLDDGELRLKDDSGKDIYLDISISRSAFDELVSARLEETIAAARETMQKAGLSPHDIGRVVFVGGPTQYKPLRDRVAFELGVAPSTDVNPMTAVAEGAAVFAESIDWSSQSRGRKTGRGTVAVGGGFNLSFNYQARTPDTKAKVVAKLVGQIADGTAFQVDSLDTGWSSGRVALKDGAAVDLPLAKPGGNIFRVFVFDAAGGPVKLTEDKISISRVAAQVDAIPASHSIGIEVLGKIGGRPELDFLVKEGDPLPQKGRRTYRAVDSLRAGAPSSLNFKLWEGDIGDAPSLNRFIGNFPIKGSDLTDGVIAKGAELICEYEVLDSGNIFLDVTVPSVHGSFKSGRNFYSRQAGGIDYTNASRQIVEEGEVVSERLDAIASKVDDPRLDQARERLDRAAAASGDGDPHVAKQAMDDIQEAKRLFAQVRKEHRPDIRQIDLDAVAEFFDTVVREHARPTEVSDFDKLVKTAQRSIENNSGDFESHLDELKGKTFAILWRQDWFVINRFKRLSENTFLFPNREAHSQLCGIGQQALQAGDIDKLRQVVAQLEDIRIGSSAEDDMIATANIVRGTGNGR
jgi:molecular chaperone DnaK